MFLVSLNTKIDAFRKIGSVGDLLGLFLNIFRKKLISKIKNFGQFKVKIWVSLKLKYGSVIFGNMGQLSLQIWVSL